MIFVNFLLQAPYASRHLSHLSLHLQVPPRVVLRKLACESFPHVSTNKSNSDQRLSFVWEESPAHLNDDESEARSAPGRKLCFSRGGRRIRKDSRHTCLGFCLGVPFVLTLRSKIHHNSRKYITTQALLFWKRSFPSVSCANCVTAFL